MVRTGIGCGETQTGRIYLPDSQGIEKRKELPTGRLWRTYHDGIGGEWAKAIVNV